MSYIALMAMLLCGLPLYAQNVKVVAPSVVALGEYFEVRYVVENEKAEGIELDGLKDFVHLSGPNESRSQSFQFINGKSSHTSSVSYTYILQPKAKGKCTVPSAVLIIDGKKVRAKSVEITVTEAQTSQNSNSSSQKRQQRRAERQHIVPVQEITDKDLFVRVTPTRKHIKEQEAVELTYSVYSRLGVGLSHVALAKTPDFKDLLAHDVPMDAMDVKVEEINGVTYKVTDCLKYVVYPQKAGEIVISPLIFECQVIQNDPAMDFIDAFFNGGMVSKVLKRSAQKLSLNVEALPQDKPSSFTGAVGDFTIKEELLSEHLRTNEMCQYRITVEGTGNMKLLLPPHVNFPEDFDTYEVKTTEDLQLTANGHKGKVVYDYTFVPNHIGTYTIPSTQVTYFNPATNKFEELATKALDLKIKQGASSASDQKQSADSHTSDIRTIKQGNVVLKNKESWIQWGTPLYWSVLFLITIGLGIFTWKSKQLRQFFSNNEVLNRQKAKKQASKRLRKAKDALNGNSTDDFYFVLHDAIQQYLMDKFGITKIDFNKTKVLETLQQHQINGDVIQKLIYVLETCEYARFAPSMDESLKTSLYEQAVSVIDSIEK